MNNDYERNELDPIHSDDINNEQSVMEEYIRNQKLTWRDFKQHLSGPVISMCVHVVLLFFVGSIILMEAPKPEKKEIPVQVTEVKVVEPPPREPELEELPETILEFSDAPVERPSLENTLDVAQVNDVAESNTVADIDLPSFSLMDSNSALKMGLPSGGPFGTVGGGDKSGPGRSPATAHMLQGVFYDIKQTKDRQSSGKGIVTVMNKFVNGSWQQKLDRRGVLSYPDLEEFYCSPTRLWNSCFYIPKMNADEAPAAYRCEKEVKTGGWVCIYSGTVVAPFTGKFRFVGDADDVIMVRFNKEIVLDYGYFSYSLGVALSGDHRKAMKGEDKTSSIAKLVQACSAYKDPMTIYSRGSSNGFATGRTIQVEEGKAYPIEILISEIPGGIFHASLFVEQFDENGELYEKDPKTLSLFRTTLALPEPATTQYPGFKPGGPVWRVAPKDYKPTSANTSRYRDDNDLRL